MIFAAVLVPLLLQLVAAERIGYEPYSVLAYKGLIGLFQYEELNSVITPKIKLTNHGAKNSSDSISGLSNYFNGHAVQDTDLSLDPSDLPAITIGAWVKITTADYRKDDPRYIKIWIL